MTAMLRTILLALFVNSIVSGPAYSGSRISEGERATLQAVMHKEISRKLVDGKFLHLDFQSKELRTLYPAKAHPMILAMGEHFVLCTDFRDTTGKSVNVDFYATRNGRSFTIYQTAIDERHVVKALMKAGRVTGLN